MNPESKIIEFTKRYNLEVDVEFINEFLPKRDIDVQKKNHMDEANRELEAIYFLKRQRKEKLTKQNKEYDEKLLQQIIACYLSARDFLYTFKYMDEYIQSGYDEKKQIYEAKSELKNYINILKEYIKPIIKKCMILYWVDAVDYENVNELSFIKRMSKDGVMFENAYTVTPYTSATMKTILCNRMMIDDKLYEIKTIDEDNSCAIRMFKENGYRFRYVASPFKSLFKEEYVCNHGAHYNISMLLWDLVREMCDDGSPCVYLLHQISGTHYPYLNGKYEGDKPLMTLNVYESGLEYSEIAYEYISEEMEFYHDEMLGDSKCDIYFSDHGISESWKERLHPFLLVRNGELNLSEDRIFSYKEFSKLLEYCINPSKEKYDALFCRDFAPVQDVDWYSEKSYVHSIANGTLNLGAMAYRGAISKKELYWHRRDGDENYYLRPDLKNDMIDDPRYQERIAYLRNAVGDVFPDFDNSFFKWASQWPILCDNYKKRTSKEIERFIDILTKECKNEQCIIKGGGLHTRKLLKYVGNKINIKCIEDKKVGGMIGNIKVLKSEEIDDTSFTAVIISSYRYKEEMKQEVMEHFKDKKIIDPYEIAERDGLKLSREFWGNDTIDDKDLYGSEEIEYLKEKAMEMRYANV